MPAPTPSATLADSPRIAVTQLAVLLGLTALVFAGELYGIFKTAGLNAEGAHILAMPVLIGLLLWRRKPAMLEALGRPARLGVPLIVVGLLIMAIASWPLNFGLPRRWAMVLVVTGCVATVGGWRLVRVICPALLLMLIAIPLGARIYEQLMFFPEKLTQQAATTALRAMPQVVAAGMEGREMYYVGQGGSGGSILLGKPNRYSALVLTSMTLIVFVTFIRQRPSWQAITMLILTPLIALVCNLLRLISVGVYTVLAQPNPISDAPIMVGAVVSILSAYLITIALLWTMNKLVVADPPPDSETRGSATPEVS